jgi:transposase InsO family protein
VSVILRRAGLGRLRVPTPPPQRYEWPDAGDLLHVDIKPLGRFHTVGHRMHGDRRTRSRGAGWEYVHVAIDDATRVAFVEVLPSQKGDATADFLARAIAWFARLGVPIRRVMSDNGGGYRSRAFRRTCQAFAVRHLRTRPYTPRTNGKAERFIQTLLREWAYARAYRTSLQRTAALLGWLTYYNRQRPHASLDYQAPWSRLCAA